MPNDWASLSAKTSQEVKAAKQDKNGKAGIEDPQKAVAELKKELATATQALKDLKSATNDDLKKVTAKAEALKKELDALTTATKGMVNKTELTAVSAKLATLNADLAALKSAGGDAKATADKLTALEKSAADVPAIKLEVMDDPGKPSKVTVARQRGDTAWMLTASAFVLFMVPGLALFYGGMVRRKNVLATMMQSMAALAVVGVYWLAVGYALAFGPSVIRVDFFGVERGGLIGWSSDLLFLQGIEPSTFLGGYDIPVYLHVMFQGMFAIITPALISGAIAERIRFWPFCIFMILWVTFVYCPLAHMVWAFDWFDPSVLAAKRGASAIGLLGKMGALDFAGGTVVHIAAGTAGLAACLVLGKRHGYPKQVAHPNSMVLTLLGAGLLWFGWFGFNGGSSVRSDSLAVSAFAATQAAAAAAGLGWMLVEWLHKGKPTALGLASGVVAGLVAVTPASGFVYMWGGMLIGLVAAVVCYFAVAMKNRLGYDDSLDAFGVHGVGGFIGAILTGVFCSALVNPAGADGPFAFSAHRARLAELKKDDGKVIVDAKADADAAGKAVEAAEAKLKAATDATKADAEKALTEAKDIKTDKDTTVTNLETELKTLQDLIDKQDDKANGGKDKKSGLSQLVIQTKAAVFSAVFAFVLSLGLAVLTQVITGGNFKTNEKGESEGLDRTEHGEVGFDFSAATESVAVVSAEPRAASTPRGDGRFDVELVGADTKELMKAWSDLCQPKLEGTPDADFLEVYPHITTIRGTTFRFRGGNPSEIVKRLESLFTRHTGKNITATKV